MSHLRYLTVTTMLVAAVVVACSELQSPVEPGFAVAVAPGGGGTDQGEACAEWSCNEVVCGHQTWPPYHACCIRTIYDPPCDYQEPCPTVEEPACDSIACAGCSFQDNECWWSGNTCQFEEHFHCADCCGEEAYCHDDPITEDVCDQRDETLYYYGVPPLQPGEWCNYNQLDCQNYCANGAV